MALVPYKVVALAESDAQGTDGKNIVSGANISLYDELNNPATLYDDENYTNGATFKSTDVNGVVVFYVEEGEYEEQVEGGEKRRVLAAGLPPVKIPKIKDLSTAKPSETSIYSVESFYAGVHIGGGGFIYSSAEDKANHNGITVIDPVRVAAWSGAQSDLSTLFTAGSGSGCFIRIVDDSELNAAMAGAVNDNSTDNTISVQQCCNVLGETPDKGGTIRIPRYCNFRIDNLNFVKRQTLKFYAGDDKSDYAGPTLNTNEEVTFLANANNAGIVNEQRIEASFHPAMVVDVKKQVTGHDSSLGPSQTRDEPARASYNILDEGVDIWRVVWQNYASETAISGVITNMQMRRITLSGITTASFSTVPSRGEIITGSTSGAKGILYSIDGTETVLNWIGGTFQTGETVSDDDETTTDAIVSATAELLTGAPIGWDRQEGTVTVSLPTNVNKTRPTFGVGGKIFTQKTRAFGQYIPETVNSTGYIWADDYELESTNGFEVLYDTTKAASSRRLTMHKLGESGEMANIGAARCHTGFSNSTLPATSSFNVQSITRLATGDYEITFKEPFARADYQVTFGKNNPADNPYVFIKTTATCRIRNVVNGTTSPLSDLAGLIDVNMMGGDI